MMVLYEQITNVIQYYGMFICQQCKLSIYSVLKNVKIPPSCMIFLICGYHGNRSFTGRNNGSMNNLTQDVHPNKVLVKLDKLHFLTWSAPYLVFGDPGS
jgi:hypothetical protein